MKRNLIFTLFLALYAGIFTCADNQTDADLYWIKEDFSQFDVSDWVKKEASYPTYPNNVNVTTTYANVEKAADCAATANGNTKMMRVRGLQDNGSFVFTVPNANKVTIKVTGKSNQLDRTVLIYRNGTLVETIPSLDKTVCKVFEDNVNSNGALTYRITAGNTASTDPIVITSVTVEKYNVVIPEEPEPTIDYSAYWIYDDFSALDVEADYVKKNTYTTQPNNITLATDSANIELGEGCTGGVKILRLRGAKFAGGAVEFTVPDAKKVTMKLTGKSTAKDRIINVFRNNELISPISNLDRTVCEDFVDEVNLNQPLTYRIVGGNNTEKPVAIVSIIVEKYNTPSNLNLSDISPWSFYPNPVQDAVYFNQIIKIARVYDASGRLMLVAENADNMNVKNLTKGIYFLKVETANGVVLKKLIKE